MDTQEQIVVQSVLLGSRMTFSTPELAGILSECERIKNAQPERTIIEIANAQVDKIKEVRGLKDDTKARVRGEINVLLRKGSSLSSDCASNEDQLKEITRQVDNLKKQL